MNKTQKDPILRILRIGSLLFIREKPPSYLDVSSTITQS